MSPTPAMWREAQRLFVQVEPLVPVRDIAAYLGEPEHHVRMHMHRRQLTRPGRCTRDPAQEAKGKRLYLADADPQSVAKALGLQHVRNMWRWAEARRLPRREDQPKRRFRGAANAKRRAQQRQKEREDVRLLEANESIVLSATDRKWLATTPGLRRCRCQECGALSASSVCPRGHTINQLPTEGAA